MAASAADAAALKDLLDELWAEVNALRKRVSAAEGKVLAVEHKVDVAELRGRVAALEGQPAPPPGANVAADDAPPGDVPNVPPAAK